MSASSELVDSTTKRQRGRQTVPIKSMAHARKRAEEDKGLPYGHGHMQKARDTDTGRQGAVGRGHEARHGVVMPVEDECWIVLTETAGREILLLPGREWHFSHVRLFQQQPQDADRAIDESVI